MRKKQFPAICFSAIFVLALNVTFFGVAQGSNNQNGIISTDTVWTKANNPYTLTGPVLIQAGITLTIKPGVIVNLGSHYIQVNGTLNAVGTNKENIQLSGGGGTMGAIVFTKHSSNNIIENAIIDTSSSIAISIGDTSPKINNNTIYGIIRGAASALTGEPSKSSIPIITNNHLIAKNGESSVIAISTSPIIANNIIRGDVRAGSNNAVISGNYIEGSIVSNGKIANNYLYGNGCRNGIQAGFGGIIEQNLITEYYTAIEFGRGASPIIRNNTIINNVNVISVPGYIKSSYSPQIYWNNIYNNSGYTINLYTHETHPTADINASYNWWGTTDTQAISQKIHDKADDFNLGTVNFQPILTAYNLNALPELAPSTTFGPEPSPTVPDFSSVTVVALIMAVTVAAMIYTKKCKSKP